MVIASLEFQATNANVQANATRSQPPADPPQGRPPKNVIVLFLNGALDSFNLLVPDPSCPLYAQYVSLRTSAALPPSNLTSLPPLPVGTQQPCTHFAVNSACPTLAARFAAGDAAFIANIGSLIEPVTRADFFGTSGKKVRLPPSLFAHNIQAKGMQNLDPANLVAKGVLGRIATSLQSPGLDLATALYSLAGTLKIVEGAQPLQFIDPSLGLPQLSDLSQLSNAIANFTQKQSGSVFGETYASLLQDTVQVTSTLGPKLQSTTTNVTFAKDNLSRQFQQVAKLIKMQSVLKTERALFVTEVCL
jgi:uncharacterized protein (DUF1501 family)